MQSLTKTLLVLSLALAHSFLCSTATGCCVCAQGEAEWLKCVRNRISKSDSVLFVKLISSEKPSAEGEKNGITQFEVVEVIKPEPHDPFGKRDQTIPKGDPVTLKRFVSGKVGDHYFLFKKVHLSPTNRNSVEPASQAFMNYVKGLSTNNDSTIQRLTYIADFLEHVDPLIAEDAFNEFEAAKFSEIVDVKDHLQPAKLRKWLKNLEGPGFIRVGLYGLMLGITGTEQDAESLKQLILTGAEEYNFGMDGITDGYLLLSGEKGLQVLEDRYLRKPDADRLQGFIVLQALRFIWEHGEERISKDRLKQSMRIILALPDLVDLAIIDLARWRDWEAMDQIVELYSQKEYDVPAIKRAIIRYLLTAKKSFKETPDAEKPPHVVKAEKYIQHFRESEPKTVKAAERYFFD